MVLGLFFVRDLFVIRDFFFESVFGFFSYNVRYRVIIVYVLGWFFL